MRFHLLRLSTPILILYYITTVFGIKCYKCRSGYDGECYDPVANNIQTIDCDLIDVKAYFCKKMIIYNGPGGQPEVLRDCSVQTELQQGENCFKTNQGDDYCRCSTDACNLSRRAQAHDLFVVVVISVLMVLYSFM